MKRKVVVDIQVDKTGELCGGNCPWRDEDGEAVIDKDRLWWMCRRFVDEQKITCKESVYQCDNVILNAPEFIGRVCDIVGYHECEDDDE